MRHKLVHLALKEHMGDCAPPEALRVPLVPGLDVDTCTLDWLDEHHAAVEIEFSMVLMRQDDEEIACDLNATWRMVYQFDERPHDEREFAAKHGVKDAWLAWKGWLEATMSWMGLNPLRLSPVAPDGLVELAREMYDIEVDIAAKKAAGDR